MPIQPDEIILASGNQKKLKELSHILNTYKLRIVPQSEYEVVDAVEDGLTFVENAIKKARNACAQTGKPAISDDSGIEVDYLHGSPGIYSARYAGESATDEENLQKLLTALKGVPRDKRSARYQCVIVYMRHAEDPTPIIAQAAWEGLIMDEKLGEGGFGYDPIFYCPQQQRSAAQLSPDEKARVSHRGKALRQFQLLFSQLYGGRE
ncbi:RdgB/HAM1 family non-canonical purine NTP pyrophosphatase [Aliikangiella sp. G2MR2-5]|uniref:RdgB/HAM1 family non-canonical purine NTP pyrophosphatase n=1 Tax=Aliikangiella sp. G2MR2-5 TaxID=2788943 RepID=UPI0018A965E1|nr:RdgB/HAM1 family non-canonical purine NTP pyrophosphatase [Aliikangiella sp. G2MR2-5]